MSYTDVTHVGLPVPVYKYDRAVIDDARSLLMDPNGVKWTTDQLRILFAAALSDLRLEPLPCYPETVAARLTMHIVRNACRMYGREWENYSTRRASA